MKINTQFAFVVALFTLSLPVLSAPATPDAGTLQRETQPSLQGPSSAKPSITPSTPVIEETQAERVLVTRFVVEGATLIPASQLEDTLTDLLGKRLSLNELKAAAQRIARYYREQGWYVNSFLPAQDVTSGTVRIQVIEAQLNKIERQQQGTRLTCLLALQHHTLHKITSRASALQLNKIERQQQGTRTAGDFVQRMMLQGQQAGEPLSATRLERGVLLADDLPGIHASVLLEAGEQAGDTNLNLRLQDTALFTGDVNVNNYGVRSTGREQISGGVAVNSPSGYGDQISLRALATEHLTSASLGYSLPLGTNGWRMSAQASLLNYELAGRFKALDAEGSASTLALGANWAWVRQASRNLYLSVNGEQRRYADDAFNTASRRHDIDALNLSLSADLRDNWAGGGVSWGSVRLVSGKLDIRHVAGDIAADKAGPKAAGQYQKLYIALNRLQQLGGSSWRLHTALNAQLASKNLASSEQMSLGGPSAVRAYPVSEATGDEGAILNIELQRPFAGHYQAALFADTGIINQHKNTWSGWQGGLNRPNHYSLSGAGVALSWFYASPTFGQWQLNSSLALPIGSNPGRDATGNNNDGSHPSDPRFWLSLTTTF